jgi:hypothetical protein
LERIANRVFAPHFLRCQTADTTGRSRSVPGRELTQRHWRPQGRPAPLLAAVRDRKISRPGPVGLAGLAAWHITGAAAAIRRIAAMWSWCAGKFQHLLAVLGIRFAGPGQVPCVAARAVRPVRPRQQVWLSGSPSRCGWSASRSRWSATPGPRGSRPTRPIGGRCWTSACGGTPGTPTISASRVSGGHFLCPRSMTGPDS